MTTTLRGFHHPAARLRDLAQQRLDRAERQLAHAQAQLDAAEAAVVQVGQAIQASADAMRSALLQQQGASLHGWHANQLIRLLSDQTAHEAVRDERRGERDACAQRCVELRQRVLGLDRVHERALQAYAAEQRSAEWKALDDQVLVRVQWKTAMSLGEEEHATG